jgi:hypothetical protein
LEWLLEFGYTFCFSAVDALLNECVWHDCMGLYVNDEMVLDVYGT